MPQQYICKVVLLTPLILVLIAQLVSSHQPCMALYGLFNSLWLYTYVSLCSRGAAVLQEPLNKCYVIAIRFIYLCGIPLSKAVSADTLITKIIANNSKLLLYSFDDFVKQLAVRQRQYNNFHMRPLNWKSPRDVLFSFPTL